MKRDPNAKKAQKTIRIVSDDHDYISLVSAKFRRSGSDQLSYIIALHQAMLKEFGHDNIDTILAEIRKWKSDAAKRHADNVPTKKKLSLHHAV